jgi:hypothetical protein
MADTRALPSLSSLKMSLGRLIKMKPTKPWATNTATSKFAARQGLALVGTGSGGTMAQLLNASIRGCELPHSHGPSTACKHAAYTNA